MQAQLPPSMTSNAAPLQLRMERAIDHLSDLARCDNESGKSGDFFAELLRSAIEVGGAQGARLWVLSADASWKLVGQIPPDINPATRFVEQSQTLFDEVSKEGRPRRVPCGSADTGLNSNRGPGDLSHLLIPIRQANQSVGVFEVDLGLLGKSELAAETIQFFAMICEIAADFLAQQELQQLRKLRLSWLKWDQFSQRLWQSLELNSVCATIANDGRLLAGCDRVSVLVRQGNSYRLTSVSGVERVEARSSATRDLELTARGVARGQMAIWHDNSANNSLAENESPHGEHLLRYLRNSGCTAVGFIPINDETERKSLIAVIVFDQFQPISDWERWKSQCELVINRSSSTLRVAHERSEIPWLTQWQRLRHWPGLFFRFSTLIIGMLLVMFVAALALIPVDFTVEGSADVWPARRRDVFAGTAGIVDQILVGHGTEVVPGQPLIVLRDSDVESDTPRITGEIATVSERLKGVQAARLSGGNSPEIAARSRQLTADEEELKERLRTLERQRLLIEKRTAALTLRSPIAGKVLTWDVEQHLSSRPVERGQSLLMIGDTSGPWVVEARVADKNVGHLLRARQDERADLPVEFMLAAEPGRTYRGHVQEMSLSSEYDEMSQGHVRLVIAVDSEHLEQLRPGATVFPRIHCGRKSLGYVWLRDLIDAIQTRILF